MKRLSCWLFHHYRLESILGYRCFQCGVDWSKPR
jgi:hypothetical protein